MRGISVQRFFDEKKDEFQLEALTESLAAARPITVSDVNRPGLALAGFTANFLADRIQILGETEMLLLETFEERERIRAIDRLFDHDLPCVIVAKGLVFPSYLVERGTRAGVPILRTPFSTTPFIHQLTEYLEHLFAPLTHIHGSLVDVYGVGLLLTGESGIGKSECALDLVERGHRLVADDLVIVTRRRSELVGEASERLRDHMEIRGIGIIDVGRMFGIRAVARRKEISVEVRLKEWAGDVDYDRLGLEEKMTTILGVKIPVVTIPIIPGKNITVLVEVVAMNHLLRVHGIRPAELLNDSLIHAMKRPEEGRP
ncbi:MAG: HPr(Ser) kinase/phosphatase [Candidatus Eisenbacteria bacterium]|nr:HPr(Ser) kinase/phosphatase [Candidatus Eisenbacteria bacterium]